jgi:hypothetical protein
MTFSYYKFLKILRRTGMLVRTERCMLELKTFFERSLHHLDFFLICSNATPFSICWRSLQGDGHLHITIEGRNVGPSAVSSPLVLREYF